MCWLRHNEGSLQEQVFPKYGVYISVAKIDDIDYLSITNIGIKPTIGGETSPLAETFIINYSGDLYGQLVTVYFRITSYNVCYTKLLRE